MPAFLDRCRRARFGEEAVEAIESAEKLDPLSSQLRPALMPLTERPALTDVFGGRPLGHPAHPMYVAVPIGCWTAALALDVLAGRSAAPAARRLVGLGVLTALPAMASGAHDWLDTTGAEQRVGLVHAAGNTTATMLFALSWNLRRRGGARRVAAIVTAAGGAAVAGAAGFLGGHLAYRRGVGVATTAFQSGPAQWTTLCERRDVPDEGAKGIWWEGVAFLVTAQGGTLRCLEDRCTHRGGPLHEGPVAGGCVTCPWHGSVFSTEDGSVVQGPASAPQPVYETRVVRDMVQIRRVEHGTLRGNLPAVERDLDRAPAPVR